MRTANRSAGEKTKEVILQTALELFRDGGFEVTTMRDIAKAAKVATGAAYYYFPSKEAIVAAYYDQVQRSHAEKVREELKGKAELRERLGTAASFWEPCSGTPAIRNIRCRYLGKARSRSAARASRFFRKGLRALT